MDMIKEALAVPNAAVWREVRPGRPAVGLKKIDAHTVRLSHYPNAASSFITIDRPAVGLCRKCDIYEDDRGRLGILPNDFGRYTVAPSKGGSGYFDIVIPAKVRRRINIDQGTHYAPMTREGQLIVVDLSFALVSA